MISTRLRQSRKAKDSRYLAISSLRPRFTDILSIYPIRQLILSELSGSDVCRFVEALKGWNMLSEEELRKYKSILRDLFDDSELQTLASRCADKHYRFVLFSPHLEYLDRRCDSAPVKPTRVVDEVKGQKKRVVYMFQCLLDSPRLRELHRDGLLQCAPVADSGIMKLPGRWTKVGTNSNRDQSFCTLRVKTNVKAADLAAIDISDNLCCHVSALDVSKRFIDVQSVSLSQFELLHTFRTWQTRSPSDCAEAQLMKAPNLYHRFTITSISEGCLKLSANPPEFLAMDRLTQYRLSTMFVWTDFGTWIKKRCSTRTSFELVPYDELERIEAKWRFKPLSNFVVWAGCYDRI